jgi:hypothetical protein
MLGKPNDRSLPLERFTGKDQFGLDSKREGTESGLGFLSLPIPTTISLPSNRCPISLANQHHLIHRYP